MQLADLAFRRSDDPHPCKAQLLVDGRHICLVPAQPVQRFGQHDLDAPSDLPPGMSLALM